jgi:predicted small lipoprotein YifL
MEDGGIVAFFQLHSNLQAKLTYNSGPHLTGFPPARERLMVMRARAFSALALMLAACGQSGPLYLPDNSPERPGDSLRKQQQKKNPSPPAAPETPSGAASPTPASGDTSGNETGDPR